MHQVFTKYSIGGKPWFGLVKLPFRVWKDHLTVKWGGEAMWAADNTVSCTLHYTLDDVDVEPSAHFLTGSLPTSVTDQFEDQRELEDHEQ